MEPDSSVSPISRHALLSASCGLVAALGFLFPTFLALAIPGVILGIAAMRTSRVRHVNAALAVCAIVVSGSVAIGGSIWHATRYRSEASPGFERVDFGQTFQASATVPQSVRQLIGRRICLKGYARPGRWRRGLKAFIMTPDGSIASGRIVHVVLRPGDSWNWIPGPIAVSGTLALNPHYSNDGFMSYQLTDVTVRASKTPFYVLPAAPNRGC